MNFEDVNSVLNQIADKLASQKANDYFDLLQAEEDAHLLHLAEMYSYNSYEEV